MRREDLLSKKTWILDAARQARARELREHELHIARVKIPEPCSTIAGDDTADPPGTILKNLRCVVDGRDVLVGAVIRPSPSSLNVFRSADAIRNTRREMDEARRCVAHWEARCRLDAEIAASNRDEQFHLRCKTKWERRRKAAQVENARKTAEASLDQVRIAHHKAHRATRARACALANAVGVKVPRALLIGCAVGNKRSPAGTDGVKKVAESKAAHFAATAQSHHPSGNGEPHTPLRSPHHHSPRSHRPGGTENPNAIQAPSQEGKANDRRQDPAKDKGHVSNSEHVGGRHISPEGTTSKCEPRWTAHQCEAAPPRQTSGGNAQKHDTATRHRGFTREWCREVDIWCLQTSCRYRQKVAHEVVRSARRLAWLQGERRASGDSEAFAALAAFGDVPDLLELLASMGELTISIEEDERKENASGGRADKNPERAIESSNIPESRSLNSLEHPPKVTLLLPPTKENASGGETSTPREDIAASYPSATDPAENVNPAILHRSIPEVIGVNRSTANNVATLDRDEDDLLPRQPRRLRASCSTLEPLPVHREESENGSESTNGETKGPISELLHRPPSRVTSYTSVDTQSNSEMGNASATANESTFGTTRCGGGTCEEEQAKGVARRGFITLNPSSLEALVGVPPLSAVVLRAGRLSERSSSYGSTAGSSPVACIANDSCEQECTNPSHGAEDAIATGVSESFDQSASRQTRVDNVEWPFKHPHGDTKMTEREQRGLRDVLEFLVLPRISISAHKSVVGSKPTLSLRLAPSSTRTTSKRATSAAREPGACNPASLPPGLRRFLHCPVLRWVGRDGGRRCLVSCPAGAAYAQNLCRGVVEQASLERSSRAALGGKSTLSADIPTDGILARSQHEFATPTPVRAKNDSGVGRHGHTIAATTPSTNGYNNYGETCVAKRPKESQHTAVVSGDHRKTHPKHGQMALTSSSSVKPCTSNTRASPHASATSSRTATAMVTRLPTAPRQDNAGVVPVQNVFLGVVHTMDFSDQHLENNGRRRTSVGIGFDRPLCHNCGRRSLRRLEETLLLSGNPSGQHHTCVLEDQRHRNMKKNQLMIRNMLACGEVKRAHPLQTGADPIAERFKGGRFADWLCLSGVALCSPCLRTLRASELPYRRLDGNRPVHEHTL